MERASMSLEHFADACYDALCLAGQDIGKLPDQYNRATPDGQAKHLVESLPGDVQAALREGDKDSVVAYLNSLPQIRRGPEIGKRDVVRCLDPYLRDLHLDPGSLVDGHEELARRRAEISPVVITDSNGQEFYL